jgi:hypothetical protein
MTERNGNQEKSFRMPPSWCGSICRNAMNEVCVEHCAVKRDCSAFEPKPDLNLGDMPSFPLKESAGMSKEEKFTAVTVYLAKVVDHLQGTENENQTLAVYQASQPVRFSAKTVAEVAASLNEAQTKINKKETE